MVTPKLFIKTCQERNGFIKIPQRLFDALTLFQFIWNFIHALICKKTPAMLEELANQAWIWKKLLTYHYATV